MFVHVYCSYLSDAGRTVMHSNIGGKAILLHLAAYPQLTVSDRYISYVQAKLPDHTITDMHVCKTGWIDQPSFKTGWAIVL